MNYIYDDTFEGFLTCVYHHYYTEKANAIFPDGKYQFDILNNYMQVETDDEKANIVYEAIANKISAYDVGRIYKVFKTNEKEKEIKLLRYIKYGFKIGGCVGMLHGHPIVNDVLKAERRLGMEIQRLYGLIRFASVKSFDSQNQIMYAVIDPDNDLLEFLAPHFVDRFKNEPFIIHDEKRGKALFSYQKQWNISEFANDKIFKNTFEEDEYQRLWQRYFDIISIKERTNPKCQKNFMPVRYWKNLPELGTQT